MSTMTVSFTALSDADLLARVACLAAAERAGTVQLVAALAEFDARRLYLGQGCSSLFTYCTQVLHLSEHAAYGRIEAARATRRFPEILDRLADGALTLTAVGLLAPHLTIDNCRDVLAAARHKTKREVEQLVATLRPQPPVAASIRKLPVLPPPGAEPPSAPAWTAPAPATRAEAPRAAVCPSTLPASSPPVAPGATRVLRPAVVAPLAPEIYKLQVTLGHETIGKLRHAQALLRHAIPSGDLAAVLDRALTVLVRQLERTKFAETESPRQGRALMPGSRHIPAAVRRAVWVRDEGRCTFAGAAGRCTERGFLEFHHVVPYAAGGEAIVETIALRCQAHNLYEAELDFGVCVPGRHDIRRDGSHIDLFE